MKKPPKPEPPVRSERAPRLRSAMGTWVGGLGDPGGPGRPPAPQKMDTGTSREYHALFRAHCPPETYAKIISNAAQAALQGDAAARQWLSLYIIPDPGRLLEGSENNGLTINILVAEYGAGEETSRKELTAPVIDVPAVASDAPPPEEEPA